MKQSTYEEYVTSLSSKCVYTNVHYYSPGYGIFTFSTKTKSPLTWLKINRKFQSSFIIISEIHVVFVCFSVIVKCSNITNITVSSVTR